MGELVENLCNIIGILMHRNGVMSLEIPSDELAIVSHFHHGKSLSFSADADGVMHVRLTDIPPAGSTDIEDLLAGTVQ